MLLDKKMMENGWGMPIENAGPTPNPESTYKIVDLFWWNTNGAIHYQIPEHRRAIVADVHYLPLNRVNGTLCGNTLALVNSNGIIL